MNSYQKNQMITISKLFSNEDRQNSLSPLNSRPSSLDEKIKEGARTNEFALNQGLASGLTSIKIDAKPRRTIKLTNEPSNEPAPVRLPVFSNLQLQMSLKDMVSEQEESSSSSLEFDTSIRRFQSDDFKASADQKAVERIVKSSSAPTKASDRNASPASGMRGFNWSEMCREHEEEIFQGDAATKTREITISVQRNDSKVIN